MSDPKGDSFTVNMFGLRIFNINTDQLESQYRALGGDNPYFTVQHIAGITVRVPGNECVRLTANI